MEILSQIHWPSLSKLKEISGLLVDLAVLLGALAAIVKFRLFNMLGHRWRSELACVHYDLPSSSVIFTADYTIHNTGQRPILVTEVSIRLTGVRQEGSLLLPDEDQKYATRVMRSGDPALKGLFQIEPGERTIFTLRSKLPALGEAVFVLCDFSVSYKRTPASYRGFYVKSPPARVPQRLTNYSVGPPAGEERAGGSS